MPPNIFLVALSLLAQVSVMRQLSWTQTDAVTDQVTSYRVTLDTGMPMTVSSADACTPEPTLCVTSLAFTPGSHTITVAAVNANGTGPAATLAYTEASDQQSLSTTIMGSGRVTSMPAGLSCPVMACSPTFATGTTVRLMAVPSRGWVFSGWGGVCAGTSPCSVLMSSAQSVTATFTQVSVSYALSATVTGTGTITSAPAGLTCTGGTCSANFASGSLVELAATPASGWVFSGWGGACSGSGACSVAMTSAKSVTAMFARLPPAVPVEPTLTSP